MDNANRLTDKTMEIRVSRLLRFGLGTASLTVLLGGIIYLFQYGGQADTYSYFHGVPYNLCHWGGILKGALALRSRAIIQFGLILLILTPVARVAFSVVAFAVQRDRLYVLMTLFVLCVLLINLIR